MSVCLTPPKHDENIYWRSVTKKKNSIASSSPPIPVKFLKILYLLTCGPSVWNCNHIDSTSSGIYVISDTTISLDLTLTNHSNRISLVSWSPAPQFYQHDAALAKPLVSQFQLLSTTFVNFSSLSTVLLITAVILKMWFPFNLYPRLLSFIFLLFHLN